MSAKITSRAVMAAVAAAALACDARAAGAADREWLAYQHWLVRELASKDVDRMEAAVLRLGQYDRAEAAHVALSVLRHAEPRVVGACQDVIAGMRSDGAVGELEASYARLVPDGNGHPTYPLPAVMASRRGWRPGTGSCCQILVIR